MSDETLHELDDARASFELGEQAHREQRTASRLAFGHYQRALRTLRSGAPVMREESERAGLEFLLAVPPDALDAEAIGEALAQVRGEAQGLLTERLALTQRATFRRWNQTVQLVAPVIAAVVGAIAAYSIVERVREPKNLAEGKPWTASSTWAPCMPQIGRCGALVSRIFFHTLDDESPWVQFDLLAPTSFSSATIVNRSDEYSSRAIPLLLEVSDDGVSWRELARRESDFTTWRPRFEQVTSRYVRLRAARRTWLHLEAVKLHE